MLLTPTADQVNGQWVPVEARNPASVCCDESLMVCALRSVGVKPHPQFAFSATVEEIDGAKLTLWVWVLAPKSSDGLYKTDQLIAWWKDAAWLKANPQHEFAIVVAALRNMGVQASEIRAKVPRLIVRRGRDQARIPMNASPARRKWLMDRLEGRIPMNTPFVEPATA